MAGGRLGDPRRPPLAAHSLTGGTGCRQIRSGSPSDSPRFDGAAPLFPNGQDSFRLFSPLLPGENGPILRQIPVGPRSFNLEP